MGKRKLKHASQQFTKVICRNLASFFTAKLIYVEVCNTQTLIERVARTGTAKVLAAHRDVQSKKHRQTVHKKASTLGYFRFVCYEGNNENMNLIA